MDITIDTPSPDQFDALIEADARAFGYKVEPEIRPAIMAAVEFGRFRIATSEVGDIVGIAGSYDLELTLPGNAILPMSGVTWVSVSPTHRRQGLLRRLMDELDADAASRNDPLMGLTASEGGIYERFGYGIATRHRVVSIDRSKVEFRHPASHIAGSVRIVNARTHQDELTARWDAFRRMTPGEISRSRDHIAMAMVETKDDLTAALHDDGFAVWSMASNWDNGHPAHTLSVHDFAATTPEAHEALWRTVLSVDLVGKVSTQQALPPGDALPFLLTDHRAIRTVDLDDGLWLRVVDPLRTFSARSYRIDARIIVSIDGERYEIDGNECRPTDREPDIAMNQAAAGSLLLGTTSATTLARGKRLSARTPEALQLADAFFGWEPEASSRTGF